MKEVTVNQAITQGELYWVVANFTASGTGPSIYYGGTDSWPPVFGLTPTGSTRSTTFATRSPMRRHGLIRSAQAERSTDWHVRRDPAPLREVLRMSRVAALAILSLWLVAADCGTRHVVVYGDSLIREAAPTIVQRLTDDPVWYGEVRQYSGGSLCNYLPAFLADIETGLSLVVVETAGNSLTPCSGAWTPGSPSISHASRQTLRRSTRQRRAMAFP